MLKRCPKCEYAHTLGPDQQANKRVPWCMIRERRVWEAEADDCQYYQRPCLFIAHVSRYPGRRWCAKLKKYVGDRGQCYSKCKKYWRR